MVGVDGNGRGSIEWGVYGVPETFVVGRDGTIRYKMVGPVTPANLDSVLKVEIEKALGRSVATLVIPGASQIRSSDVQLHIGES